MGLPEGTTPRLSEVYSGGIHEGFSCAGQTSKPVNLRDRHDALNLRSPVEPFASQSQSTESNRLSSHQTSANEPDSNWPFLVRHAGFEPAILSAADFKSAVCTISTSDAKTGGAFVLGSLVHPSRCPNCRHFWLRHSFVWPLSKTFTACLRYLPTIKRGSSHSTRGCLWGVAIGIANPISRGVLYIQAFYTCPEDTTYRVLQHFTY